MNILIIGAGAYGLALSTILSEKNKVTVYSSLEEEINKLNKTHKNEKLFPNKTLPKEIEFISKINKKYDLIVLALPTIIIEQELLKIKQNIKDTKILVTAKGIYNKELPYQIVKRVSETEDIYVLSGPGFAKDVIEKEHLTLTLAGSDDLNIFNDNTKIEYTDDIIGTELCGMLKNIYAIGAGILGGMNVSESTKAAYLTNIINETSKIIETLDGKKETILLSCGIGDTILTCTSTSSRNYTLGYMIGKKENIQTYLKETTVEGINSLKELKDVIDIKEYNIIDTIYNIIYNNQKIEDILKA